MFYIAFTDIYFIESSSLLLSDSVGISGIFVINSCEDTRKEMSRGTSFSIDIALTCATSWFTFYHVILMFKQILLVQIHKTINILN